MGSVNEISANTYTGTGAAQTITLGYRPSALITINVTDGDSVCFHFDGMTAASSVSIGAAAATVTNAVTFSNTGFSLGTDASVNENAKVFRYIAIGNAPAA